MCCIVDANVYGEIFDSNSRRGRLLYKWIKTKGKLVIGGTKLMDEIRGSRFDDLLKELQKSGNVIRVNNNAVDDLCDELRSQSHWRSNDHHIIALAQISGADLLFSEDRRLKSDFKQTGGAVYSSHSHTHLLRNSCTK